MTVTEKCFEMRDKSPREGGDPFCVGRTAHIRPTNHHLRLAPSTLLRSRRWPNHAKGEATARARNVPPVGTLR